MSKRIRFPFAENGDRTAIQDVTQSSGIVNYQDGYPAAYSLDIVTDPTARRVNRDRFNQLMFDITSNIKEWQEQSFPDYIQPSANGGVNYAYPKGMTVRINGGYRISLVDGNDTQPDNATNWADAFPLPVALGGTGVETINEQREQLGIVPQATQQEALDGADVDAYMSPDLTHEAFGKYGIGKSTTFTPGELVTRFNDVFASGLDGSQEHVILLCEQSESKKLMGRIHTGRQVDSGLTSSIMIDTCISLDNSGELEMFTVTSLGSALSSSATIVPITCTYNGKNYYAIDLGEVGDFRMGTAYAFNGYSVNSNLFVAYRDDCSNIQPAPTEKMRVNGEFVLVEGDKASDSDLLDGEDSSFYRNASNLNQGIIPTARLPLATTSTRGAVDKATTSEAESGEIDKFPDAAGVHAALNRFGIGVDDDQAQVTNLNTLFTTGNFPVSSSAVGLPADVNTSCSVDVSRKGVSDVVIHTLNDGDRERFREYAGGSWGGWRKSVIDSDRATNSDAEGNSDSKYMTPESSNHVAYGKGQTLQDVTASRIVGSLYTNNTPKPITITLRVSLSNQGGFVAIDLDGEEFCEAKNETTTGVAQQLVCVVPQGSQYKVRKAGSNTQINYWKELA